MKDLKEYATFLGVSPYEVASIKLEKAMEGMVGIVTHFLTVVIRSVRRGTVLKIEESWFEWH